MAFLAIDDGNFGGYLMGGGWMWWVWDEIGSCPGILISLWILHYFRSCLQGKKLLPYVSFQFTYPFGKATWLEYHSSEHIIIVLIMNMVSHGGSDVLPPPLVVNVMLKPTQLGCLSPHSNLIFWRPWHQFFGLFGHVFADSLLHVFADSLLHVFADSLLQALFWCYFIRK